MNSRRVTTSGALLVPLLMVAIAGTLTLGACGGTSTTSTPPGTPSVAVITSGATPLPTTSVTGTIAFTRVTKTHGKDSGDIYAIRSDGTGLRRLAASRKDERQAAWSPDGSRIAYLRYLHPWIMDANGSRQRSVTVERGGYWKVAWSPDGARIALVRLAGNLAIVDADGGGLRNLTKSRSYPVVWNPVWAPDGRILFTSRMSGDSSQICAIDPDGSGVTVIVAPSGADPDLAFSLSPDGKWLAFWDSGSDRLVRRPADGRGTEVVLVDNVTQYFAPPIHDRELGIASSWSPDGTAVAFAADESPPGGSRPSALYIVNADGSGLRKVPNTGRVFNPAWRPR